LPLADVETDPMSDSHPRVEMPDELPVVPLRQFVVFPYMALPLFLARDRSMQAVDDALAGDRSCCSPPSATATSRTRSPTTSIGSAPSRW
jgi:ATP-dependent Lon protease